MGYSPNKQKALKRTSMWLNQDNLARATSVSEKISVSRTQLVDGLIKHCLDTMKLQEIADIVRPKIEKEHDAQPSLFS